MTSLLGTSRMIIRGGRIVTPTTVLVDGWVAVDGGVITAVGTGWAPPDQGEILDVGDTLVLPGFIDLHVHGAAGATFDEGPESIATGLAAHRGHGTTRSLVSLVTAPLEQLTSSVAAAAGYAAGDPTVLGLHLEGPFLSVARRGVHDPSALIDPDPAVLQHFLDAGAGRIRVVTLAPERPGGLAMIRQLTAAGVRAAVGHSDADYEQALAAFAAGADLVTHAFNGMRPLHHRDPGIIGAAMDAGAVLEVINDGVHAHPATVRMLRRIAPDRMALITDAMAATGAGDGDYRLAGFDVRVTDGVARLAVGDSIAGSTLTMDVAVRRAVQVLGMSLVEAANAAALVPATVLGVSDRYGGIEPGRSADLVFTDADLTVLAVLVGGEWVDERRP